MSYLSYKYYNVTLTFVRPLLATNPADPQVANQHIIQKQRDLILENSKIQKEVNKYLDNLQISEEKGEEEINAIIARLEEITGVKLDDDAKKVLMQEGLKGLKETFAEFEHRGLTVFYWNEKQNLPMIGDHMVYGYLKEVGETLCKTKPKAREVFLQSITYTQSSINRFVRCTDRFLTFDRDILRNPSGSPKHLHRSLRAMTAQGPRISLARSEQMPEGTKLNFTLKILEGSPITIEHLHMMFECGEHSGFGQWRNAGNGQFTYELKEVEKPKA